MPGADIALCVGVHVCVARVPEEPDVFLVIRHWLGMEKIIIDFGIGAQAKKARRDGV